MTTTLAALTARTGRAVLDHLEQQTTVPVTGGLQAQGDLVVIPFDIVSGTVRPFAGARWQTVPPTGIELLRSAAGGNPHTLVCDPGACRWTTAVEDDQRLALGMIDTDVVAYLIHPEHGATGLAPGRYLIRRQREGDGAPAAGYTRGYTLSPTERVRPSGFERPDRDVRLSASGPWRVNRAMFRFIYRERPGAF